MFTDVRVGHVITIHNIYMLGVSIILFTSKWLMTSKFFMTGPLQTLITWCTNADYWHLFLWNHKNNYLNRDHDGFNKRFTRAFPSFACVEAQFNCKLVTLAELATDCLFIQMMMPLYFCNPFEHKLIALFMSHALIMGDGCDSFPLRICFFDRTGV